MLPASLDRLQREFELINLYIVRVADEINKQPWIRKKTESIDIGREIFLYSFHSF